MPRWTAQLEDLLRRTTHRGQLTIDGQEAAETVVARPEKVIHRPQTRRSGPGEDDQEKLFG